MPLVRFTLRPARKAAHARDLAAYVIHDTKAAKNIKSYADDLDREAAKLEQNGGPKTDSEKRT